MTTLDTHEPTAAELAAIDVSAYLPLRRLTREECTTPELRMRYLLQWLDDGAPEAGGVVGFSMEDFFRLNGQSVTHPSCGTVCCLAGSVMTWWGRDRESYCDNAARLLGIPRNNARELFLPDRSAILCTDPAWAARCIRKYQRTGIVDWAGTRDAP